jgi:hypothetical protein
MARGGARKGSGRKSTGKVAMLVRVKPEVRARLERDAKRAKRSLSHEVELQLDALSAAPRPDAQMRGLCYLVTQIAEIGQTFDRSADPEFSWRDNRFDFEAFKYALLQVLDQLAPTGSAGDSRYPMEATPERMGLVIAWQIRVRLTADAAEQHVRGDRRGAGRGSLFYAFPQVARDLGLNERPLNDPLVEQKDQVS